MPAVPPPNRPLRPLLLLAALVLNGLATGLPLGGRTTAEISDSFNILFVPAGYVFSIWGLIYLALIGFAIYQALPAQRENPHLRRIGYLFQSGALLASMNVEDNVALPLQERSGIPRVMVHQTDHARLA